LITQDGGPAAQGREIALLCLPCHGGAVLSTMSFRYDANCFQANRLETLARDGSGS